MGIEIQGRRVRWAREFIIIIGDVEGVWDKMNMGCIVKMLLGCISGMVKQQIDEQNRYGVDFGKTVWHFVRVFPRLKVKKVQKTFKIATT